MSRTEVLIMDSKNIQLNKELCNYLIKHLRKTRNVLEDLSKLSIGPTRFSQERAFREMDLVMKHADDLVLKCMCKQSSWLDTTITLANIKEEVLQFLLDLCFWIGMLKIAILDSNLAKFKIFKHVTKVVKEHEDLLEKLSKEGSSLQKTTQNDMEHLLTKLLEVKINHASSGQTIPNQDREYILSVYLLSRIEDDNQIEKDVDSLLKEVTWDKPWGGGAYGNMSEVTWLQQKCALKALKYIDKKEATITRSFNHPHIVQFLWYWEHEKRSHIMVEWMPADLYTHIQHLVERNGGKPFELHVAIDIMLQIANAMQISQQQETKEDCP
jgi:hypothetical protein